MTAMRDAMLRAGLKPRDYILQTAILKFIKANKDGKYRSIYLARKAYEKERAPGMRPIHAHRRAQRYMEKRLLKDLWQAWRRTERYLAEKPKSRLSAPEITAVAA